MQETVSVSFSGRLQTQETWVLILFHKLKLFSLPGPQFPHQEIERKMSHLMGSGPYKAERTGPPAPSRGGVPHRAQPPRRCSRRWCQASEGEGSPGGAPSGTNGPSTGQLLKGREGRSPQRSCFNKRFFPEKGKAGEGERGLFKATLLLAVSVCLPGPLATAPDW